VKITNEGTLSGGGVFTPHSAEELERREHMRPRTFDLSRPDECERLMRETVGYAKVSLHYSTDDEGRRYACEALERALRAGFRLVPPQHQ
jgi:hypothetical protein